MQEIQGKYETAKIYTDVVENVALEQIKALCDQEFIKGSCIRVMPDVHAGVGCTIGTTMTIKGKVVPNLVGVDIGCGMETIRVKNKYIELGKLDKLIYQTIPSGFAVRAKPHPYNEDIDLSMLKCLRKARINTIHAQRSIGTLGGGNHFIEVNKDEENNIYVVVHSGSRHLGVEVAKYYQEEAYRCLNQSRKLEIEQYKRTEIPKQLAYVEGNLFEDYIHDMKLVQQFAMLNRKAMIEEIIQGMKLKVVEEFSTIHNYIDMEAMILRKGAVSAKEGEQLLIPINMRDGSLICIGKGNAEWNYSAPHGAGRLISRAKAKETFTVSQFKKEMKNIFTTSVNQATLDECPMAYKKMEDIVNNIEDTVEIVKILRPIYNFKAGEE